MNKVMDFKLHPIPDINAPDVSGCSVPKEAHKQGE